MAGNGKGQFLVTSDSKVFAKQHRAPCSDCPWSRKSIPGWLGPYDVKTWVQIAHANNLVDCHTRKDKHGDQWQCAGVAVYRANVCKRAEFSLPADTKAVFSWGEFEAHHERKKP